MSSPGQRQHPFWDLVPLELLGLVLCAIVLLWSPFRDADAWLTARLLRLSGKNAAPERVVAVLVKPERVRGVACGDALSTLLKKGDADLGLLLPPLDGLCPSRDQSRLMGLSSHTVRRDSSGHVVGFEPDAGSRSTLRRLGIEGARWVAPRPSQAVPTVGLSDLEAGRMPVSMLRSRVVVAGLDEPSGALADVETPLALQVAGAISAALEDRPHREAPRLLGFLTGLCLLGLIALRRRRPNLRFMPPWLNWTVLGMTLGAGTAGIFGFGYLLPLPSLAVVLVLFWAITALPTAHAARRARLGASQLLSDASELGSGAGHRLPDDEFWTRMTRRAEQTHPADGVLVAELPPFEWRLKVWPNGDLNESIIRERRRDVRRTPFIDESGRRRTKIVDGFLVMNGIPAVLSPLEAAGEIEGYLLLIGKAAAHAFVERPQATEQLSRELALLIRHRRLERRRADDWRRAAGMLVEHPEKWSETLIENVRTASGSLDLFMELFRSAPVGLLYADSFGDVRLIGQRFVERLTSFGLDLPESDASQTLPPGALPLSRVLATMASRAGASPISLSDLRAEERSLEIDVGGGEAVTFAVRRIESGGEPGGFVATLASTFRAVEKRVPDSTPARLPERGDPLTVFSLAEVVSDCVEAIARDAQVRLRFQTPRAPGHVIAHRQDLTQAFTAFLIDVARSQPAGAGPVITMKERRQWVELTVIDLKLGVPEVAMQRTVLAPSVPPPGLEPLAGFVRAIEESHGQVRVAGEQSWGVKLTVSLLRARPRVQPSALGQIIRISEIPQARKK